MTANWKAEPAVHLCKIRNNCTHTNTGGNVNTRRRLPSVTTLGEIFGKMKEVY